MQKIELNHEELDFRSREAFRTLRTNIEFSGDDVKVICLTSCTPNEGKSDTSFELGKAFAQNGKKVLLIDADLRKSVMRHRHKKGKVWRSRLARQIVALEAEGSSPSIHPIPRLVFRDKLFP